MCGRVISICCANRTTVIILQNEESREKMDSEDSNVWEIAELDTTTPNLSEAKTELAVHESHEMKGSAHHPVEMDIAPREVEAVRGVELEAPRGVKVEAPRDVEIEAPKGVEIEELVKRCSG